MTKLSITLNVDTLDEAREALGSAPVASQAAAETQNELMADLNAVSVALNEARKAHLDADAARADALDTANRLGKTLDEVAGIVGFGPEHLIAELPNVVRSLLERTAKTLADADAEARRLRSENEAQVAEIKRLNDYYGLTSADPEVAKPVEPAPTRFNTVSMGPLPEPIAIGAEVWIGEPGNAKAGKVTAWRENGDGTFCYRVEFENGADIWADEGDGDFHLERPRRRRRSKAEMVAEREQIAALDPGTVMLATIDGEQVQASIVRRFEGTTKYEVDTQGYGIAVVDAADLAPMLALPAEHEFTEQPVSDGPNDDPLVNDEQYQEVVTAFQALGLRGVQASELMRANFPGVDKGRDLRVSQARQLVDVILPGSVKVPETLPF